MTEGATYTPSDAERAVVTEAARLMLGQVRTLIEVVKLTLRDMGAPGGLPTVLTAATELLLTENAMMTARSAITGQQAAQFLIDMLNGKIDEAKVTRERYMVFAGLLAAYHADKTRAHAAFRAIYGDDLLVHPAFRADPPAAAKTPAAADDADGAAVQDTAIQEQPAAPGVADENTGSLP